MIVVLDTASFVSGVFWRTEAHGVLRAFAEGRVLLAYSRAVLDEHGKTARALRAKAKLLVDPQPWLNAVAELGFEFDPAPLGRKVCRDPGDDKFIACAAATSPAFRLGTKSWKPSKRSTRRSRHSFSPLRLLNPI